MWTRSFPVKNEERRMNIKTDALSVAVIREFAPEIFNPRGPTKPLRVYAESPHLTPSGILACNAKVKYIVDGPLAGWLFGYDREKEYLISATPRSGWRLIAAGVKP